MGETKDRGERVREREMRRLPAPWSVSEIGCAYGVSTADGTHLAYVYYEDDDTRRGITHLLTRDEARRVAGAIARLPQLLAAARPEDS